MPGARKAVAIEKLGRKKGLKQETKPTAKTVVIRAAKSVTKPRQTMRSTKQRTLTREQIRNSQAWIVDLTVTEAGDLN